MMMTRMNLMKMSILAKKAEKEAKMVLEKPKLQKAFRIVEKCNTTR